MSLELCDTLGWSKKRSCVLILLILLTAFRILLQFHTRQHGRLIFNANRWQCVVEAVGTQWTPPSCPSLLLVEEARDCASCPCGRRLAPSCLVHSQPFERAIEDGTDKSGARLRLDAALEAAEDGHTAGLQVRSASRRDEAESTCGKAAFLAARVASLAWLLAMPQRRIHDCPSSLGFITSNRLATSCRIVVVVAQPVLRCDVCSGQGCSGKTAPVSPACTICTSMSSRTQSC